MDKNKNLDTGRNFYLLPDLGQPEMKRLLDRLGIGLEDIQAVMDPTADNSKPLLVSGKNIYPAQIQDKFKNIIQIPAYKMSEMEDHLFNRMQELIPAYFMTADTKGHNVHDQIVRRLGINYDYNAKDMEVKEPVFLIFKNRAYACNTEERIQELVDNFGLGSGLFNAPCHVNDLLDRQQTNIRELEERSLSYIPPADRTLPVCYEAVRKNPMNIKDIPEYMLSCKFVGDIIHMRPSDIQYIPKEKLNRELCLKAIDMDSDTFINLHNDLKTPEICEKAFYKAREETPDPAYLQSIVAAIPHADVCMKLLEKFAYSNGGEFKHILAAIPENVMNRDIAGLAVSLQEYAILDIPEKFITEKMVQTALSADGSLIFRVPDRYKTSELCEEILFNTSDDKIRHLLFSAIPYPQLIMKALRSEQYKDCPILDIVTNIPKEVMTKRIAMEAIMRDANCLPHIPFHLKDESICLEAIEGAKTINPLYAIPRDSMTDKVCTELVGKFPQAIGHILPEEKRSPEICLIAVKKDGSLKEHVPESISKDPGMNLYKFAMLVSKKVSLDFNQTKELYEGRKVEINYPTSDNKDRRVHLAYNPQKNTLDYSEISPNRKISSAPKLVRNQGKGLNM